MDYLVFDTEAAAQIALETIYSSMVAGIDSPDLLDVNTDEVIPQDDLTEDDRAQFAADNRRFPIFGTNASSLQKNTQDGYTTAWAVVQQTVQGEWVFAKPDDSLMGGVIGYTVEPYDPGWFPLPAWPN